jgi:transposase-like protein
MIALGMWSRPASRQSILPTIQPLYLYRAVDSRGQTIDLLSARRDAEAAKRFFRKAWAQPHTVSPRTITVDKNGFCRKFPWLTSDTR